MATWLKGFHKDQFDGLSKANMMSPYCWKRDRDSAFIKGDTVYLHSLLKDCKHLGKDSQFLFEMRVIESTDQYSYLVNIKYVEKDSLFVGRLLEKGFIHDRRVLVGLTNRRKTTQENHKNLFEYIEAEFDSDYPDESDIESTKFPEGGKKLVTVNKYERSAEARAKCIEIYETRCYVCTMCFEHTYGEFAKDFIHVHHIKPLHEIAEGYEVCPKEDLRPVCPNCHAMLHKRVNGELITIDELKKKFRDLLHHPKRFNFTEYE